MPLITSGTTIEVSLPRVLSGMTWAIWVGTVGDAGTGFLSGRSTVIETRFIASVLGLGEGSGARSVVSLS
ncbi:hypothetical protein, partial [Leptolyngbya sp. 'hensonii']|uniref:hypothetical protein n=1 Tax=Leptolyngbya sp. 'hensonii' TaxID=1922337 RepID=UPI001C0C7D77